MATTERKVKRRGLFAAVFHAARKIVDSSRGSVIATVPIGVGDRVLRTVARKWCPFDSRGQLVAGGGPKIAIAARAPVDEDSDGNRFSGKGYGDAPPQAGLYVSLAAGALAAEVEHYNPKVPKIAGTGRADITGLFSPAGGLEKVLFSLRVTQMLSLVDFGKNAVNQRFLAAIDRDANVIKELDAAGYTEGPCRTAAAARRADDYSVSRALALAIARSTYYDGILFRTARSSGEYDADGDNAVLFGANNAPHPKLRAEFALLTASAPGSATMTVTRVYFPGFG